MRLDIYLVQGQWFSSRTQAAEAIRKGWVKLDNKRITKPSFIVDENAPHQVEIATDELCPYVSRGGLKLEKAIYDFGFHFEGCLVLDIGASTGGFTHCALNHGASRVWAIDVGTSQLHPLLRADSRVMSLENTDIRTLNPQTVLIPCVDWVVCDVSFISLRHIIPHIPRFLKPEGGAILLIKPQFEAGPENLNKGGLVKKKSVHKKIIRDFVAWIEETGYQLRGFTYAPLQGKDHNIEYLAFIHAHGAQRVEVERVVDEAFKGNGWE
ncbi:MAG: TlyA family RNA methyltransferase [Bacteroidales bacterium]